jgi:hypothetical protein
MDMETLRNLRPASDTSADVEAAIGRARAALAEAERATAATDDGLLRLVMDGAGPIELEAAKNSIAAGRATAELVRRVIAELEARLPAARKRETVARLRELAAKAERASAQAADAWQGNGAEAAEPAERAETWAGSYAAAATRIRDLLGLLAIADQAADAFGLAVRRAVQSGEIGDGDAPPLQLPARELLGASGLEMGRMVQLPSPDGRLRAGAIWFPDELRREAWREVLEARARQAAEEVARRERDREAQAEMDARRATMSHDEWRRQAGSAAR